MKAKEYKIGEITKDVWCGDFVVECEFIKKLPKGQLLFYNPKSKVFHAAFWEVLDGEFILNGWNVAGKIKELL